MIATRAIDPNEQSLRAYGVITSPAFYRSQRAELPSIGTFLSQGAAVGALFGFFSPVIGMLSNPENGYNFLLIGALPVFLGAGMLFGLCEATVLWVGSYLLGHRIHPGIRAVVGPVILVALIWAYAYIVFEPSPYQREVSMSDYLFAIGVYAAIGMILGLVIGSRIRPVSELIRGTTSEHWPVVNALTGLALRLIVTLGLMISILLLILSTQGNIDRHEFTMAVIAVSHFGIGLLIIFARIPFWLLLPLALIINFPVVTWITDVLTPNDVSLRNITYVYLALWTGFLLCRVTMPRGAVAFIRRELRYYFIE